MLIKVEAFPDDSGKSSKTLHVCLATAKQDDGVVCSVGRKAGDVVFPTDKSVSRQHSVFRLVGKDGGQAPRNNAETKACEKSDYGMCLVLENAGKGGSYIAIDKKPIAVDDDSETDDGGKDDDDDETDEEGVSQRPKKSQASNTAVGLQDLPALSATVKQFWRDKPVELLKMDAGDTQILPLSNDKDKRSLLVQCGRFDATIRLNLIPINVAFSGLSKKDQTAIRSQLPSIGALPVPDELPNESTTYLITASRMAGAKQLITWCYGIPMVSRSFIQAMSDRSDPSDPLPDPTQFPLEKTDDLDFWDTRADPELLSAYTLLSVESNELERLAIAAGVKSMALYDEDDAESAAQACIDKGDLCFAFAGRKRLTKKLSSMGVPLVSAKKLASAVSKQMKELQDEKGNPIVKETPPEEEVETEVVKETYTDDDDDDDEDTDVEGESSARPSVTPRDSAELDGINTQPPSQGGRRASPRKRRLEDTSTEPVLPEATASPRRKRGRKEVTEPTASPTKSDEVSRGRSKRSRGAKVEKKPQIATSPGARNTRSARSTRSTRAPKYIDSDKESDGDSFAAAPDQHSDPDENMEDVHSDNERKPAAVETVRPTMPTRKKFDSNKKTLVPGADKNGWFKVAPKEDSVREECRKRAALENADENGGIGQFLPAALTGTVAASVVAEDRMNRARPRNSSRKGGPDFKRFRKNAVIRSAEIVPISLTAVKPKESERQRQLDEDERALEEEQRRADALFRGDGLGVTKKRRRREVV